MPHAAARGKRREVVRIGPVVLPAAAVAWGLSLAAHGTVLVVGIGLARSVLDKPPAVRFARGDGGSGTGHAGGGVVGAGSLVVPMQLGTVGGAAGASGARLPVVDDEPADPTWSASPTPPAGEMSHPSDEAVFGLPAGDLPALRFNSRFGGGRGAGGESGGAGSGGAGSGGTGDSALPGSGGGNGKGGEAASGTGDGEGLAGTPGGVADGRLPAPRYPRESRLRGEEGTVVVEVDLAADGSVTTVRVAEDCGYPRLAAAALEAVGKATFVPATRGGRPVPATVRIPFRFRLKSTR